MLFKQLFDQETWTYTYVLADPESREAIIIDPVLEGIERDLKLIAELNLELIYTLDTHVHADHVTGSGELGKCTGALSGIAAVANVACVDRDLAHADRLRFGRYEIEVRSTPGHTDGCLTFVVETGSQTLAFTGDAILIRGCGRTDFQQGDAATLYHSVHDQIFTLPEDTIIYPGHDYKGHIASSVGEEKAHNPRLNIDISKSQFVDIMGNLNLAAPKRIQDALPANMECGLEPDSDQSDGSIYKTLHAEKLDHFSKGLIVDVRSSTEFYGEAGHLPNTVLAPLPELKQHAMSWQRDSPLLVVCWSGRRSAQACTLLSKMGFTNITNLSGGMMTLRQLSEVTQ